MPVCEAEVSHVFHPRVLEAGQAPSSCSTAEFWGEPQVMVILPFGEELFLVTLTLSLQRGDRNTAKLPQR